MLSHEFLFYRLAKEKERMFLKEAEAERLLNFLVYTDLSEKLKYSEIWFE